MRIIFQVTALLATLELQESARRKGHFALYNCLVLGHTKYSGVQRVYCNPFPAKTFHASHRMDFVMIRPLGIENGAFVVSPDTVWYARVKAFWENLRLCLLETQEPFHTTCKTSFRAHPATAGREPATDAGCGLSTRGHWDGHVICNEWKGG